MCAAAAAQINTTLIDCRFVSENTFDLLVWVCIHTTGWVFSSFSHGDNVQITPELLDAIFPRTRSCWAANTRHAINTKP